MSYNNISTLTLKAVSGKVCFTDALKWPLDIDTGGVVMARSRGHCTFVHIYKERYVNANTFWLLFTCLIFNNKFLKFEHRYQETGHSDSYNRKKNDFLTRTPLHCKWSTCVTTQMFDLAQTVNRISYYRTTKTAEQTLI